MLFDKIQANIFLNRFDWRIVLELKGQIEEIIYRNDANSYSIAVLNTGDIEITIVGYLPFVEEGDTVKVVGKMVVHQDYGEQFKVETFEKLMPETSVALEKYLASGAIKGIGPATARKIIEKFGEESVSIFKFEPMRLAEIKGISKDKAYEIGEEFNEKWELWQIVGFLERFGISANNSKKVYDALGKEAVQKIEDNPYVLVDIVYGVDFYKIDKIALEIGIPKDNDFRIKSGIKYALLTSSYNGHLCVQKDNLISFVKQILDVDLEEIENNLVNLRVLEEIVIEERNDDTIWVYLYPLYVVEKNISDRLIALKNSKNVKYIKDFKNELKIQEDKQDITLSEKQFEALEQINDNNVCIITGGPGTRKNNNYKMYVRNL